MLLLENAPYIKSRPRSISFQLHYFVDQLTTDRFVTTTDWVKQRFDVLAGFEQIDANVILDPNIDHTIEIIDDKKEFGIKYNMSSNVVEDNYVSSASFYSEFRFEKSTGVLLYQKLITDYRSN